MIYLLTKLGDPKIYVDMALNVDEEGRHTYHTLLYRGNYDVLVTMMNYERVCLKKVIFDELQSEKKRFKFKNLDIKQGHLVSTVYHDAETIKRHIDFNLRAIAVFEKYSEHIKARYSEILLSQDRYLRNPLHYAAMSKFTSCSRCLHALLNIKIDDEPDYTFFEHLYFEIAALDRADKTTPIDPRKSAQLMHEFEHLLDRREFKRISN